MISYANSVKNRPIFADRSINDGNGNEIARTYATKAELPTVDQTYDAASTNAQSGVAVAQAIASIPQTGGSDEWWGGDPGRITLPAQTIRLKFKDLTYDPRNETDTSFTDHFQSITKVSDGVYDFLFANAEYGPSFAVSFKDKYLIDNEFVILAFNFGPADASKYKTCSYMFQGCTGLRAVYNVRDSVETRWDSSLEYMFDGCTSLTYFSSYDSTGQGDFRMTTIERSQAMFSQCTSLIDCNLVLARVSGSMDCSQMFKGCTSLLTGPAIDRSISNANSMFQSCRSLRGFHLNTNLGYFDIPADTACNCSYMFDGCKSLEAADIAFFLYHTVKAAQYMFRRCYKLKNLPRHIKLASGVSLIVNNMFERCWSLENIPDMDYGNINTYTDDMFAGCVMLSDISNLASVTWNSSLDSVSNMFNQCWSIEKGLKDVYDNMAATATITSHSNTFKGCGTAFSNPDLAQIPASWGGTGS